MTANVTGGMSAAELKKGYAVLPEQKGPDENPDYLFDYKHGGFLDRTQDSSER